MTKNSKNLGFIFASTAYFLWGLLAYFWHLLAGVNSVEVFSYRILSTLLTMALYFIFTGRLSKLKNELTDLLKSKKSLAAAVAAAFLIAVNWLTYIYAIAQNHATDASLGYYVMPLLSVLLAVVFLHEKLERYSLIAIGIAAVAVILMTVENGQLPLLTLVLAFSFGFYGLVKKNIVLSSDVSITFETLVLAPFVLIYLIFFAKHSFLSYRPIEMFYLIISGIVTSIPLLLFAESLKHASLITVGFLQYISPTLQLFIALFAMNESLTSSGWQSLVLILISILVFVVGQLMALKKEKRRS